MRPFWVLTIFAAAVAARGAVPAQIASPPFSVTLNSSAKVLKTGSEERLEIVLKNTSTHEFSLGKAVAEDQAETQYAIDVRDGQGHPVAPTEYGRARLNRNPTNRFAISEVAHPLKPGETLTDVVVVTRLYDLSRPGKYTVRVSREISKDLGRGSVRSNPVTITVVK